MRIGNPGRGLPTVVVPVLLAVAIFGYVAGRSGSQSGSTERQRTLTTGHVVLNYPSGWRPASGAPGRIPGLVIVHPTSLAPGGNAKLAGLLVGTLPHGELSPLPRRFVASLRRLPDTEIVNLLEIEAYSYAKLSVPGFDRTLTLFVIPNPGGDPTALACYAPSEGSSYMHACKQSVATATLGQSQTHELTPEANYARRVSASIALLERSRAAAKRAMRSQLTVATLQDLATRLADGFSRAAASLSALEPAFAAGQAQAALSGSIVHARDAYNALAAAAGEESATGYAAARRRIAEAESDVDWALENYALLGYSPTFRSPSGARS